MVPKTTHHTGHHESFEGVIYNKTSNHTKFYLRPKTTMQQEPRIEIPRPREVLVVTTNNIRSRRWPIPAGYNIQDIRHALLEAHYV